MYAAALETHVNNRRSDRALGDVPYCFILDDAYRVMLAGPSTAEDPLAHLYAAEAQADALPGPVDRVVRALTATWRMPRTALQATAAINNLHVTVAPLHGFEGRRIAVFVQRIDGGCKPT